MINKIIHNVRIAKNDNLTVEETSSLVDEARLLPPELLFPEGRRFVVLNRGPTESFAPGITGAVYPPMPTPGP
jgi:hypothetical protein